MRVPCSAMLVMLAACSPPTSPQPPQRLEFATAAFLFRYSTADRAAIATIAARAEDDSHRVVSDLRATGMPRVQVTFYDTHAQLAEAVRPFAGAISPGVTGLVTSASQVHMLSPAALGQAADRAAMTVVHEFAHCATLHVAPQSGNNPRWLWETIASYEARQFVDPRTLTYLASGIPSLTTLSDMADTRIYDLGYVLGEFIVETGGLEALRALAESRGDTTRVLGLDLPAFESRWHAFLRARYGV